MRSEDDRRATHVVRNEYDLKLFRQLWKQIEDEADDQRERADDAVEQRLIRTKTLHEWIALGDRQRVVFGRSLAANLTW